MRQLGSWSSSQGTYKDSRKQLEYLEALIGRGGGLDIENLDTGESDITPKWVPITDDPKYEGAYNISPAYASPTLIVPRNMKNLFKTFKDLFTDMFAGADRRPNLKAAKDVTPESQERLEMFVKEFEKAFQTREKPEDPKNLEESIERLQALAGINKRVL